MKCPNCGNSLWLVRDVCPFCKTTISPEVSAATPVAGATDDTPSVAVEPTGGESLVTLVKCATLAEADVIRAQLEAADIRVFLPDEALMQTIAWSVSTYGFIRVQVASHDYEAAQQVISSLTQHAVGTTEPSAQLAELPLSWPMRWLAFTMPLLLCPGLLMFAVAKGSYSRQGYDRKATELWHWLAGGIVFWGIAFFVFVVIRALQK